MPIRLFIRNCVNRNRVEFLGRVIDVVAAFDKPRYIQKLVVAEIKFLVLEIISDDDENESVSKIEKEKRRDFAIFYYLFLVSSCRRSSK